MQSIRVALFFLTFFYIQAVEDSTSVTAISADLADNALINRRAARNTYGS
jgi:hypothetical protein